MLKVAASGSLVLGVVLMVCWPWVLRMRPHRIGDQPVERQLARAYEVVFLSYAGTTMLLFVAAAALAMVISRIAREEYALQAQENIRSLVEGSLKDIRDRRQGSS